MYTAQDLLNGFPNNSERALAIDGFVIPFEVRRSFIGSKYNTFLLTGQNNIERNETCRDILSPMNTAGLVLALLATLLFGVNAVFLARVTRKIGPLASLFLFQGLGVPLFVFLIPLAPPTSPHLNLLPIAILGILFSFVYLIYLQAVKVGELAVVGPINQLYAVVTAILGIIFLHESFGVWKIIAMLFIFAGVILLGVRFQKLKSKSSRLLAGVPYVLVSALGTGIYLYVLTLAARDIGWFFSALGIRVAMSATLFCILLLRHFDFSTLKTQTPWKSIILAAALDVGAFSLYNYAISHYEVSTVTIITSLQAAVIALFSWIILKEKLNKQQIIGLIVAVVGLVSLQMG
jgi:drug/metabolite transporter (DMT)-like permease